MRERGDQAIWFTERFDGYRPEALAVPEASSKQLGQRCLVTCGSLELAHRRITDFHQRQRPADIAVTGPHGEQLGRRWRPWPEPVFTFQAAGLLSNTVLMVLYQLALLV